jgi:hypothetical protein
MKKLLPLLAAVLAVQSFRRRGPMPRRCMPKIARNATEKMEKGETKMGKKLGAKDYTDAKVQAELKDDAAFKAIKEGLKDKDGKVLMKPQEGASDQDIKDLVAYMRTFKK